MPNISVSPTPSQNKSNILSPVASATVSEQTNDSNSKENIASRAEVQLQKLLELKGKTVESQENLEDRREKKDEIRFDFDRDIPVTSWQRPDSMTIPIGGVWHPGQSEDEDEFMKNLSIPSQPNTRATKSPTPINESMEMLLMSR